MEYVIRFKLRQCRIPVKAIGRAIMFNVWSPCPRYLFILPLKMIQHDLLWCKGNTHSLLVYGIQPTHTLSVLGIGIFLLLIHRVERLCQWSMAILNWEPRIIEEKTKQRESCEEPHSTESPRAVLTIHFSWQPCLYHSFIYGYITATHAWFSIPTLFINTVICIHV